jgi:hypothetical protein
MNRIAGILVFFLLAGAVNQLFAQSSMAPGSGSASSKTIGGGDEISLLVDEESKIYYVDFEPIQVNINEIVLKNASGAVLHRENVSGLPVNAMYELDMNRFGSGNYRIELHTFIGVLSKDIQVR